MDTLYVLLLVGAAYAVGFLNGDQYGVDNMRRDAAQVRVSDYVIGYSNTVTEEDLALVNPELREAALEK
jgi:hypothetical protein